MPGQLEPAQDEQADEVAQMEAVRRGIKAHIKGDRGRVRGEEAFEFVTVGHVGDKAAPLEVLQNRGRHRAAY